MAIVVAEVLMTQTDFGSFASDPSLQCGLAEFARAAVRPHPLVRFNPPLRPRDDTRSSTVSESRASPASSSVASARGALCERLGSGHRLGRALLLPLRLGGVAGTGEKGVGGRSGGGAKGQECKVLGPEVNQTQRLIYIIYRC